MSLVRSSDPARLPVELETVRRYARIDDTYEDGLLTAWITEATEYIEQYQQSAIVTQTWTWKLDKFTDSRYYQDGQLYVPKPPLQSVTSITYTDTAGVSQTWSSSLYTVDTSSKPGRILPAYGQVWPTARDHVDAITIVYVAGYGATPINVPMRYRNAICMYVAGRFENRDGMDVPDGVHRLLDFDTYRELI